MNVHICICCGEPMRENDGAPSRNPNICASCSSLADGMDDTELTSPPLHEPASDSSTQPLLFQTAGRAAPVRPETGSASAHN